MHQPTLDSLFLRFREEDDLHALGQLFDRTAPGLIRLGQRLLGGDRSRAEDLVSETFLAILQGASNWDPARPVLPWIVGVLGNQLRRERRRQGRVGELEQLAGRLPEREVPRPEKLSADREARSEVEQAIAKLPEVLREVLRGKLIEGRETGELAAELGLSGGALRVRLHRGLQRLRQVLPAGIATAIGVVLLRPSKLSAMRAQVLSSAQGGGAGAVSTATGSVGVSGAAPGAIGSVAKVGGALIPKPVTGTFIAAFLALLTIAVILNSVNSGGSTDAVDAATLELNWSEREELQDVLGGGKGGWRESRHPNAPQIRRQSVDPVVGLDGQRAALDDLSSQLFELVAKLVHRYPCRSGLLADVPRSVLVLIRPRKCVPESARSPSFRPTSSGVKGPFIPFRGPAARFWRAHGLNWGSEQG